MRILFNKFQNKTCRNSWQNVCVPSKEYDYFEATFFPIELSISRGQTPLSSNPSIYIAYTQIQDI